MKVKATCLPFVFVKLPSGQRLTVDIRLTSLVIVIAPLPEACEAWILGLLRPPQVRAFE